MLLFVINTFTIRCSHVRVHNTKKLIIHLQPNKAQQNTCTVIYTGNEFSQKQCHFLMISMSSVKHVNQNDITYCFLKKRCVIARKQIACSKCGDMICASLKMEYEPIQCKMFRSLSVTTLCGYNM